MAVFGDADEEHCLQSPQFDNKLRARQAPKATQSNFIAAAVAAKTNCPIARLLDTTISMTASFHK